MYKIHCNEVINENGNLHFRTLRLTGLTKISVSSSGKQRFLVANGFLIANKCYCQWE